MIICGTAEIQGCSDNTRTQCASWRGHSEASTHSGLCVCVCVCLADREGMTNIKASEL